MDKYELYLKAVQDPEGIVDFIENECRKKYRLKPKTFGEDFCGTFALSCAWVSRDNKKKAVAVDLSQEPIQYGMRHYASELSEDERKRLTVLQSDVRHPKLPKVDVICAFNFSYFVFKQRADLLAYFKNCKKRLGAQGVLFLDMFGGSEIMHRNCDEIKFGKYIYYWDQMGFDPLTHEAKFYIHFKKQGTKKRLERAFRYDWRVWTIPEVRDLLTEAGFRKILVEKEDLRKTAWIANLTAR